MLYVGNFSYNDELDAAHNYCLMPCIVKAADADEALEKFANHFEDIRQNSDLLEGAKEIYLDSLIELAEEPEEPLVTQWQKIVPTREGLCSLVSATPLAEGDEAISYEMRSEPEDEEAPDDADEEDTENTALEDAREIFGFTGDDIELEGYDEQPFIIFE
ncbi:MAG: hypothetical protein PUE29_03670 [Olsenella sp.]|nr:hypothetical protein [Olsenella sp.]